MKSIVIDNELWKELTLLKVKYNFSSMGKLIESLIILYEINEKGGKKCLTKTNTKK